MLNQLNISGLDKVQVAIKRLQLFEPPDGYYVAFSGGKDSCVIKTLADMAGVKYDAHYNHTSVDPPELIYFIRENHPDVKIEYPRYPDGTRVTMWNLIPKKNATYQVSEVLLRVSKRIRWRGQVCSDWRSMG